MKGTAEPSDCDRDEATELSEVTSYFHTTMRIGKSDIHELTNKAAEMALDVGFFGGVGELAVELVKLMSALSWSWLSLLKSPPTIHTLASQRMVK